MSEKSGLADLSNLVRLDVETASPASAELYEFCSARVRGQHRPIKHLAEAFELRRAGFQSNDKPVGAFLFLGPSGTGKTMLAEVVAEYIYKNRNALTRVSGETFKEPHATSRLTGPPPGYVGFGIEPVLAQASIDKWGAGTSDRHIEIRTKMVEFEKQLGDLDRSIRNSLSKKFFGDLTRDSDIRNDKELKDMLIDYQRRQDYLKKLRELLKNLSDGDSIPIILIDEIEKASNEFHNIFLNIFDRALLPMSNSSAVTSFKNAVIIATSNVGSEELASLFSGKKPIGFRDSSKNQGETSFDQDVYDRSMLAARKKFRPEFLNRFNHIDVFRPLSPEDMSIIFDDEFGRFAEGHLKPSGVTLTLHEDVKSLLLGEAADRREYGARLLNRKMSDYFKEQIARLKNRGELSAGSRINVVLGPRDDATGKVTLEFYKEK